MKEEIIRRIGQHKLIAILRGLKAGQCLPVTHALLEGGFRIAEIAYDPSSPETWSETARCIRLMSDAFKERMLIGAGTVTCPRLVEMTCKEGGSFIISPDTNEEVIRETARAGLVSIPGAMTCTEILRAHALGADFVKLFPIQCLGPDYIRAVKSPLNHIRLIAVGGIDQTNLGEYLNAGASGVGIGGKLVSRELLEAENYPQIARIAHAMVRASGVSDEKTCTI